jgi:hypothetical protein
MVRSMVYDVTSFGATSFGGGASSTTELFIRIRFEIEINVKLPFESGDSMLCANETEVRPVESKGLGSSKTISSSITE